MLQFIIAMFWIRLFFGKGLKSLFFVFLTVFLLIAGLVAMLTFGLKMMEFLLWWC